MALKYCECGCGRLVSKEGNRYIHGHSRRGKTDSTRNVTRSQDGGKSLEELVRKSKEDFEFLIDSGSRRWLRSKLDELQEIWTEIVRMNQLADVSIAVARDNFVFLIQNQQVNVNINVNGNGAKDLLNGSSEF